MTHFEEHTRINLFPNPSFPFTCLAAYDSTLPVPDITQLLLGVFTLFGLVKTVSKTQMTHLNIGIKDIL